MCAVGCLYQKKAEKKANKKRREKKTTTVTIAFFYTFTQSRWFAKWNKVENTQKESVNSLELAEWENIEIPNKEFGGVI